MANVKISELPVATSLNGADSFPVVQGGVTKQATKSVLFASPTFTGTTTADIVTATGNVSFDGGAFVFNDSGADKDARFEGDGDPNLLFLDASTDRVGIGTNAPGAKLEVVGAVKATVTPSNSVQSSFLLSNSAATSAANLQLNTSGGLAFWNFQSGGAGWFNSATLDSSGNLGIGVTPSAWGNIFKSIQAGSAAAFSGTTLLSQSLMSANAYNDGSNLKYINTAEASYYQQNQGVHSWHIAPSGTAGNAISFTQAMTLDASGNLIHQVNGTAPTLSTNSTMSFELTSNTSLKIVVRGTDGVTRSVSLTLS